MTLSPSLAAPLSKALKAKNGYADDYEPQLHLELLAALRADPDVLKAVVEALHAVVGIGPEQADAGLLLDLLLGAGPNASGEAAE